MKNKEQLVAVDNITQKAILQSQARAVKGVNQEQLALYYGVGRYISENTRNQKWGSGALKSISERLRQELPGLRGFSETNLKNMRLFYGAWNVIEPKSPIAIGDLAKVLTPKEELQRIFEKSCNTGDYRADEVWADGKCRRLCRRLKCSPTQ